MPRIRSVKPSFFQDEDLSALPPEIHLMAAALLPYADDEGYFKANDALVKAHCCPLREDSVSVHGALSELSRIGFIQLGTGPDGKRYGHVRTFGEHQRVNRPSPSKIATLDIAWDDSLSPHPQLTEGSLQEGKGKEGKGREGRRANADREASESVFITLPLSDSTEHPVTEADVQHYTEQFPAVDVRKQLRQLQAWLYKNPAKLKSRRAVRDWVASCLKREQNGGKRNGPSPTWHPSHREADRTEGNVMDDNEARKGLERIDSLKGALDGNG